MSSSVLFDPSALIRRMVPRQAAVPWIRRRVLGWCSTLLSPRVSVGSPSCTARTQTTTRPPKPCHATPPSTVRGKHEAITLDPSCGRQSWKMLFLKPTASTHTHARTHTTVTAHYPNQHSNGYDYNYASIMLMKSWWILLTLTVVLCFLARLSVSLNHPKPSISVFQYYCSV